jgi:hypothetical protein
MKTKTWSFLKYNKFIFGNQKVSQFVVFECKSLFSIIFFYFHKSDLSQDRFHTHAFNAFSIKIFGEYTEYILKDEITGEFETRRRSNIFQYFPRDSYHKIGNSNGCMTLLFSGKWKKTWKEYKSGNITHYTWGREGVSFHSQ